MKCPDCQLASNGSLALSDLARDILHQKCLGAYINQRGERKPCDCECHAERGLPSIEEQLRSPLPVLSDGPSPDGANPGTSDRKKAGKRPPRGNKRCEHCGAPTGGRFAVGHDAKLKSELAASADAGGTLAWAELVLRGWADLVSENKVSGHVRVEGRRIAEERGYALVEERNRERQGISSEGASS